FTLRELMDGALDDGVRSWLAAEVAVQPAGVVDGAVVELPGRTTRKATRWSYEEQWWTRLAESTEELGPKEQALAEDWVATLVLDYLSGTILRRNVEQDEAGRLWLVDNRETFLERPEAYAVAQILGRLKRCRRWPAGLRAALGRLDVAELDRRLRPGSYEHWLVYPRALREVGVRRRALASWLEAQATQ
ncbi:MAG: hypothetical protein RMJ98_14655, partial [Myxococcales bacterium]|nr:hypothetical protein [Polyangiaceae bacterium]MDW8250533.1 hypothetical protein [Myxococcales bacterium]